MIGVYIRPFADYVSVITIGFDVFVVGDLVLLPFFAYFCRALHLDKLAFCLMILISRRVLAILRLPIFFSFLFLIINVLNFIRS